MRLPKPTNAAYAASRRAVVSTLLGLSALPALPLDAVASAAASSGLQVFAVESAALDPRSHRALILGNGLRVLLTSYPKAAKGAASMNVQVGYMTDPSALPGLAHFCEHMLFLGTKRFPNEGDFERLSGVWHLLGKEVATVPEEYEPLQAPNDGTDPFT